MPVIPFRLLVVGDFSREGLGVGENPRTGPMRIDKDNFDEVVERMGPSLLFEAPNTLAPGGPDLTVSLEFKRLKDFEGAAVARQVPALAELAQIQKEIHEAAAAETTPAALADWIAERSSRSELMRELVERVRAVGPGGSGKPPPSGSTAAPAKGDSPAVASILDMVDLEGESQAPADAKKKTESALGSVISSVVGSTGAARVPTKGLPRALDEVDAWFDAKLGPQLDAILHHPDFQSMESAWRGLRFLVERTDFRKDIRIEALAARKKDLRKVVAEGALQDELNSPGDSPLSATLCAVEFDANNPDIELLDELAVKSEMIQAPVVAQAGAAFFGRDSLQGYGMSGSIAQELAGERYTKWRGLRGKEEMRWAALAVNRFLLRRPAEAKHKGAAYTERADEASGAGLLWASAVWALGACMTRSFAEKGWAHFISGMRDGGGLQGLALRSMKTPTGKVIQMPLETAPAETPVTDLVGAGLIPLQTAQGTDSAHFTYIPTLSAPKRYQGNVQATQEAALHSILPYQLFAGRMAQWLGRFLGELAGAGSAEQIQTAMRAKLTALLGASDAKTGAPRVRVEVSDHDDRPDLYQVCLEIVPAFKFFGVEPRLQLAVGLRK
jgi:type VI secretion system protein ImpC